MVHMYMYVGWVGSEALSTRWLAREICIVHLMNVVCASVNVREFAFVGVNVRMLICSSLCMCVRYVCVCAYVCVLAGACVYVCACE